MSVWTKIQKWWIFHVSNRVVWKGETGGFKFVFRKYTLDISTLSGNFSARFTASEHPYAYLISGREDQVQGYAERLYMIASLMTTEQQFVNDLDKAINAYNNRLEGKAEVVEDETEEKIAIEEVKAVQDYVDAPKKVQRKMERDANGRFKKVVKEVQKNES